MANKYYLCQKIEHECFIEDDFEGPDFETAIRNAVELEGREVIMGTDIIEVEWTVEELIAWLKEDQYEYNFIYESDTPFKRIISNV